MGLQYQNLDDETRHYMLEEINLDVERNTICISNWLTAAGKAAWADLLRLAATAGTDDSLANDLVRNGYIETHYERRKPKGGYTVAAVPYTAQWTMSEGEFNRFYVRGLCRRAIANGIKTVIVYRAKAVENPRPASEDKIGMSFDPETILNDLRQTQGLEPALGLPPGPNSGLTVRLP